MGVQSVQHECSHATSGEVPPRHGNNQAKEANTMPSFDYTVDDEPYSTTEHQLTPRQILVNASIDAATHYLVEIRGNKQFSYQDQPDDPIQVHEHQKFVSVFMGPTPVSCIGRGRG